MESPVVLKRKIDSLVSVLKKNPEHTSKTNDTIRLNTVFALINRTTDDTLKHYLKIAFNQCNGYSPIVSEVETKDKIIVQEAIKKDAFIGYYLKMKSELMRVSGKLELSNDDKVQAFLYALKISEKIVDNKGQAQAYIDISDVYLAQSVFNKAIENLILAQNIYKKIDNKDELAYSYLLLGEIYGNEKRTDKSLECFLTALEISKNTTNLYRRCLYYEDIGNCYIELGNYPKAIENHLASLKISEQLKDVKGVGDSYGDIAGIYFSMKDYQKSLDNFLEALYKYKKFGKPFLIANAYRDVATINYKLNRFDVAIKTLDSALVIYEQLEKEYSIAQTYDLMSLLYVKKGNSLKAIDCLLKGIDISKKNHFMDLLNESYRSLSDIYVEQNDFKNAYKFHVLYSSAKDSLVNNSDETMENINSMQSKFDKEKKEQEKLLHEAVVAQKEAKLEQEKTQRYALYGGLVLVIAFSVFVFNRFRITQKQNVIIEQQKQMVDAAFKHLDEKNKEVMASITYAQRIQRALITSELYIEKQLNRLNK